MNGGLPEEKLDFGLGAADTQPPQGPPDGRRDACPTIPGHELLRCISRGSYGEVWLARNVFGQFRAVKILYRHNFTDTRPFDREFEGIKKFEPVSRTHGSLVDILHIGRDEQRGCFYHYAMELAGPAAKLEAQIRSSKFGTQNFEREC